MSPICIPRPPSSATVFKGFVVVVREPGGREYLTNADLTDQETAEHEAAECRKRAAKAGTGCRYEVCTVTGEER